MICGMSSWGGLFAGFPKSSVLRSGGLTDSFNPIIMVYANVYKINPLVILFPSSVLVSRNRNSVTKI